MKKEIVINEKSLVNLRKHAYKQKDKRASSLMPKNDDFTQKDKYIIVEYSAILNSNAVIGLDGNENEVYLEYSNKPDQSGSGDKNNT